MIQIYHEPGGAPRYAPSMGQERSEGAPQGPPGWLPPATARLIEDTTQALAGAFGEGLQAAILVGAAMNPARGDRARAPEVLAIVEEAAVAELGPTCQALRRVMSAGARVRLLTQRELERSLDVFALEIAEWKARHRLLRGRDPLPALQVEPAHLRHAIETELRGLGRRIRNRVLSGVAAGPGRDDPRQAVLDGVDRLLVVCYHGLALLGEEPPVEEAPLLRRFAERAGADAAPLLAELGTLRRAPGQSEPLKVLRALQALLGPVTDFVDTLQVGP